ncbi:MAG: endonuclease/exonuclease/phosphatase family protein [Clostridiales bacterium]|nr:endonuclease/exonuclease/phosphatase family protein [Clostridiales bacterium]
MKFKKTLSLLLAVILLSGCVTVSFAADENADAFKLGVISFNVDGLPVPSFLSSTKRPPSKATKLIAREINKTDCDILCAQEDFNFDGVLEKNLDMKNRTVTSGPAVVGDGLNIFSKYPIFNVGRVLWDDAYGIFDCGSDELTPKGILYCTVEVRHGIFVDVYTLHADAWEDDDSMYAKVSQFDQLLKLIETNSADRAVILTGDFNTNYAVFREGYKNGRYPVDLCQKLLDNFIGNGFKDAWIECNTDGNYDFTYYEMKEKYGCDYPRVWDTLDHIYYRDGAGVSFELESAVYDDFDCEDITWEGHLSDHAAVKATFNVTIERKNATKPEKLERENSHPVSHFFSAVASIARTLFKVIKNLPSLFKNGIGWLK